MWREWVERFYPVHGFRPGASEAMLAEAERRLGHHLPTDLRNLLAESDGVRFTEYDLHLIWKVDRIVVDNLGFRSVDHPLNEHCMPFDPLIFFADAGNGDLFGFPRVGSPRDRCVFAWDHEDDSRKWVAPDLLRFLEWSSDGRVKT
jgi:SMI1-KNR4 cell-wall